MSFRSGTFKCKFCNKEFNWLEGQLESLDIRRGKMKFEKIPHGELVKIIFENGERLFEVKCEHCNRINRFPDPGFSN